MKARILLLFCSLLPFHHVSAQCPNPQFTASGPGCAGIAVNFTNTSSGAVSYRWDFCAGDFDSLRVDTNNITGFLNTPSGVTPVSDISGNYVFACSRGDDKIVRYDFGNGFDNPYTLITDLGNIFGQTASPNGIAFYQENSIWYALVLSIFNNTMTKITFGNGLSDAPTAAAVIVNSNLNFPRGIKIIQEDSGDILALVANFIGTSITTINFGNSINNVPVVGSPYTLTGSGAMDLAIAKQCGNYYVAVGCYSSNEVVLVNYGNSLLNTPLSTVSLFSGLFNPSGVSIVNDNNTWYVLAANSLTGNISVYNLGPDFSSPVPVLEDEVALGGGTPAGINLIKESTNWYGFVTMEASNLTKKLNFRNPCNVNQLTSTDANPAGIVFNTGGSYQVVLEAIDASGSNAYHSQAVPVYISPVADFSVSGNCIGDQSVFTDSSTLSSGIITNWYWNFGDGNLSTLTSPVHTYIDTGTYSIVLITLADNGCSDTTSQIFSVSVFPQAAFSTTPGCSETNLIFTDLSNIAAGSIDTWLWMFGNGDSSLASNPVYAYPTGGNYMVSLTVTSEAGCSDSISQNLAVIDRPVGAFIASNTCVGQPVQFTDNTSVSGTTIISYDWDFGDSNLSTLQNPTHSYAGGVATYPVRLILTAANGCIDTVDQNIKINNIPTAAFSISPSTICQSNDVLFTDLSNVSGDSIAAWFWDFGDGFTDTVKNPVHQFAGSGTQTISLIAYAPSNCPSAIVQQNINVIASPAALYSFSDACQGSITQFTDLSTAPTGSIITSRHWNFSTGDSSTLTNPVYLFPGPGIYPVTLTITTDAGCLHTFTTNVPVHANPEALFTVSNPCTNQPAEFNNFSMADSNSVISAYEWNFGDFGSGAANTSTLSNPVHTYGSSGNYDVFLIVTTNYGCKDTAYSLVRINNSAPSNFTYSPTCYGDLMEFFNPGSSIDSAYYWNFGDNQSTQLREPAHFYAFPGNYMVTLTVYAQGGCASSVSKLVSVSPIPTANFAVAPACINTPFQFTDNSTISNGSIANRTWTINNTIVIDSITNPVYSFTDTGNYSVRLNIVSDIGCPHSVTKTIRVHPLPVANFSFEPQFGNPPLDVQFSDYSSGASAYVWDFGDGTNSTLSNPSHIYLDTGLFVIEQKVYSAQGCADSVNKNIYVIKPVLDIAITGDSSYISGNYFHLVAKIANLGTRQIDSVNIEGRLADGTNVVEKYIGLIPNGPAGIQWYTFHATFPISASTKLDYYCIRVYNPNGEADDFPSNNEKCFSRIKSLAIVNPYPNPFTENLTVRVILPFEDAFTLELTDHSGKLIQKIESLRAPKGLNEFHMNSENMSDGIYSLIFRFRDEIISRQVVKNSFTRE